MSAHTPGPWKAAWRIDGVAGVVAHLGENRAGQNFVVEAQAPVLEEQLAPNAYLIAAAPDALAGLEAARAVIGSWTGRAGPEGERAQLALLRINRAIAKAEGLQ